LEFTDSKLTVIVDRNLYHVHFAVYSSNCSVENILSLLITGVQTWTWTTAAEASGVEVNLGTKLGFRLVVSLV